MRNINKIIKQVQSVIQETELTAIKEEMVRIIEDKINNTVSIIIQYEDVNGKILDTQPVNITADKYDLLMSANPTFAPSKPANEYREADLWYIIDLIRSETATQ